MLDRTVAAQSLEIVEINMPVVDLITSLAQEIADHILARTFRASGRGDRDKIACCLELGLEAGIDGIEDFLDIVCIHGADLFQSPQDQTTNGTGWADVFHFQNRTRLSRLGRMTISRTLPSCLLLIATVTSASAMNDQVPREQDIVGLRLGQRVMVDDGTCGAGQIKEVSGAKMTPTGVLASRRCVPRSGPKKK